MELNIAVHKEQSASDLHTLNTAFTVPISHGCYAE